MYLRPRSKTEGALPASFGGAIDEVIASTERNVSGLIGSQDADDDVASLCSWTTDTGEWEGMLVNSHVSSDMASDCSGDCDGYSDTLANDAASPLAAASDGGCVSPVNLPQSGQMTLQAMRYKSAPVCYLPMIMPLVPVHPFMGGQSCPTNVGVPFGRSATQALQQPAETSIDVDSTHLPIDANAAGNNCEDIHTTLILRNIPVDCTRDTLLNALESVGFRGVIDFIHLPVEFKSQMGLGYAIVNMVSNDDARRGLECLDGFSHWPTPSTAHCEVGWNVPTQGVAALIERYRNSPLMHDSIPEKLRPVLLLGGVRVAFPEPTCRIRPPRIRRNKC